MKFVRLGVLLAAVLVVLAACGDSAELVDDTEGQDIVQDDTGQPGATEPASDDTAAPPENASPTSPPTTGPPPLTLITQPPDKKLPSVTLPPPTGEVPVPDPGGPVEQARADLASRLGVPVEEVSVVQAGEVTWRDGSLGCPQPGMAYTQALVNGMQILLQVDGTTYAYHSGGTGAPFYCADPQEPLPPEASGFGDS